jgi:hypothetical protein
VAPDGRKIRAKNWTKPSASTLKPLAAVVAAVAAVAVIAVAVAVVAVVVADDATTGRAFTI